MTPLVTVGDAVTFALVISRIVALLMAFPFFNTTMIPMNVKVYVVVVLAFFFMKLGAISVDVENFHLGLYVLLILKELLVGFSLGVMANIFISAFSYAAEIVSYFMGLTVANTFDPTFGQVSILSRLYIMIFYIVFFVSGAYKYFFSAILLSFHTIAVDQLPFHQGIWEYIVTLSKELFIIGFKLAFPFALIIYLVNLSLALVNRLIPQINVFIVGLPLQIFVGLASLAIGASVLVFVAEHIVMELTQDYIYLLKNLG